MRRRRSLLDSREEKARHSVHVPYVDSDIR